MRALPLSNRYRRDAAAPERGAGQRGEPVRAAEPHLLRAPPHPRGAHCLRRLAGSSPAARRSLPGGPRASAARQGNASAFEGAAEEAPVSGGPVSPRSASGAPVEVAPRGAGCSGGHVEGSEGALGPGAPAAAWERGPALEAVFWGLPAGREAPAQRCRAGTSPAAAPSGRAGTSARHRPSLAGPGQERALGRIAPPGGRFRARGGAVEECGDNAPSVTAGPRRGRERRRGR